ncbi:MAG: NAD kinase [Alcaligenaceae bacterium]|jgi:NAD+ kinase|nr:NAD kinase [Alcaligenaceae bacterium]
MHFSTAALFGRYQDSGMDAPLRAMAELLKSAGLSVVLDKDTAIHTKIKEYPSLEIDDMAGKVDLAVVMGGDGTVLGVGRKLSPYGIPILGINHGRLGFITDIPMENATGALEAVLDGKYSKEQRSLLSGEVIRDDAILTKDLAINDVVLNRSGYGGMIEIEVNYNDSLMYKQRADGLIVSTPTGSTAYSLSANGPIMHPALEAFLLVPVAPQTLSARPIAVPDSGILTLTLQDISRGGYGANVHFDMQTWTNLHVGDKVVVKKAQHKMTFLHPIGYSFFGTLRQKMNWNIMPEN